MTAKLLILPITGMTCANCATTIERNLKRMDGMQSAAVNLAAERATVEYDAAKLSQADVLERVAKAGYGVALGEVESATIIGEILAAHRGRILVNQALGD